MSRGTGTSIFHVTHVCRDGFVVVRADLLHDLCASRDALKYVTKKIMRMPNGMRMTCLGAKPHSQQEHSHRGTQWVLGLQRNRCSSSGKDPCKVGVVVCVEMVEKEADAKEEKEKMKGRKLKGGKEVRESSASRVSHASADL